MLSPTQMNSSQYGSYTTFAKETSLEEFIAKLWILVKKANYLVEQDGRFLKKHHQTASPSLLWARIIIVA